MTVGAPTRVAFACPACGAPLPDPSRCDGCGREFAGVDGVPDLRLEFPDPYLTKQEDLARARKLAEAADGGDFADLLRLYWTMNKRAPDSAIARTVSSSLCTRAVEDHRNFSGLNLAHNSSTLSLRMLNVSSSKKISFIWGKYSSACFTSRATLSVERVRQAWPEIVCGHMQKVQRAGQPRVV